jgi:two-component system sensor histidine kinase PilS (NtrC family)
MGWISSGGRDLSGRIKWLMILRIVVVTVMLGFTVLLQLREGTEFFSTPMRSLYLFIGFFYFLTIAYSIASHLGAASAGFALLQIGVDLVLLSGIVLLTGGTESLFSITYFLVIIGASTLFYRWGGILAAAASALLYGAAVAAPLSPAVAALVGHEQTYLTVSTAYVGYKIVLNVFGFFLVAALSSSLAESLRLTGEALSEKSSHLAELEKRSENILQNISSGLITTGMAGKITYVNRTAERISGIDAASSQGRGLLEIFQLKDNWNPYENLKILEGPPFRVEGWVRDGPEDQYLGMTFSLLRDEGESVSGVICSFQDLTQIRKMEEQIRRSDRLAVVGELAAGMAHEIRNPLASLSGSIQLLSEDLTLEDTNRELMEIVNREVSRLNSLITDFLHFASPRPLQLKVIDLLAALQETVTLLQQSSGPEREVRVSAPEGDYRAEVDPMLMKQVFWNLARNAVEAMPEGGELVVAAERFPVQGEGGVIVDNLEISFADTGAGIPSHEVDRVFTPFYSTKEQGTGLGLSIVFKIVEAHGGRVEVESRSSGGTVFRVRVPARQGAASLAASVSGEAK